MKIIRRSFQIICSVTLISIAAFLVTELWVRSNLQYNETGRYFDEEHSVVYQEQALPFYLIFLLIVVMLLGIKIRWILRGR